MFNIDRQKFGAFIAMLRKEKGMTQKELAEQLFISDKAVSKWETGASVPNIDLLVPLADIMGITVTELLMCQRMEQDNALSATQVEQVVKAAISYSEKPKRTYQTNRKWGIFYLVSLLIACLELLVSLIMGCMTMGLIIVMTMGAGLGIYFCFFAKEKLPSYYDENRVSVYTDGLFELSLPGLSFHNGNWGKILDVGRIWAIALMVAYPVINYVESLLFQGIWLMVTDLFLPLFFILGGLFIPAYMVGKKYE